MKLSAQITALRREVAPHADLPPALSVWEWAEKHRRLGKEVTAKPGRYRVDLFPYQREPQESPLDDTVSVTVLQWAKRLGKTEMINNVHGRTIHLDPRNILVGYPTLDSAKKWSKQFFMAMVRSTHVLRLLIRDSRTRDANNTILSKQFPGGVISGIGANSPSAFRQIQAPVITLDEIDAMENGAEGDPVELAFGRAENYADCIQILASTPGRAGQSRIAAWMAKSDYRKWFVPCPKCSAEQVLEYEQIDCVKGKPETAVLLCAKCAAALDDSQRVAMIMEGLWRATQPFDGIRGYWLNGMNTLFPAKRGFKSKLHQFVADFEKADADESARQVWVNTFAALPYESKGETVDSAALLSRRENYEAEIPDGVLFCTGSADVQGDRIEGTICGWGAGEECWFLKRAVFLGNPELSKVWSEFDDWITQPLTDRFNETFRAVRTFVDMRHKPKAVCAFTKIRAPLIYACYGADTVQLQIAVKRKRNTYGAVPFCIGVTTVKDILFARLKMTDAGPRYIHFPDSDDFGQAFFDSLTAEKRVTTMRFGFPDSHYEKIRPRNEELDKFVYAFAAMDTLKSNLEVLAKKRANVRQRHEEAAKEDDDPTKKVPIKLPELAKKPKRNFVTGWQKW